MLCPLHTELLSFSTLFLVLHLLLLPPSPFSAFCSKRRREKGKPPLLFLSSRSTFQRKTSLLSLSKMSTLQSALICLVLLGAAIYAAASYDDLDPNEEEWESATATSTKEANGSIITEGACGYGDLHKATYGKYGTGLSTMLFNKGSTCGACFEIRCVDHIRWCRPGSPSVVVTATDFCPPNYGLSSDYGGWCNFPREHFEMSEAAFAEIAVTTADIVPVQYRRVDCERDGGMRFTISGHDNFYQVLISNVGLDGEVIAVKIKGSRTGWISMARNWGQYWECSINLKGQALSFEVTTSSGKSVASYNVAPANWQFGQTFEGKQIYE